MTDAPRGGLAALIVLALDRLFVAPFRVASALDAAVDADQDAASYPYCREGHLNCLALCDCRDTVLSRRAFRAARMRARTTGQEPSEQSRTRGNLQLPERREP